MGEVFTAISTALEVVRKIQGIESAMQNADLRGLVLDLREDLLIVRERSFSLAEENADLRRQLAEALSPPRMTVHGGLYYERDDGPFCTACFDKDSKAIRLTDLSGALGDDFGKYRCPVCGNYFS